MITLSSIKAVILDAEEQQSNNHRITEWLKQLKEVMYDAEDVLDDFAYQALRKKVVKTYGGFTGKVRHYFSSSNPVAYRLRLGHEIKDLRLRLDEIVADQAQFKFAGRLDSSRVQVKEREMTDSFLNSSDLIGREGDVEAIVKFLLDHCEGHANCDNVSAIPIVGIGGLGKTALAKMVFNDQRVVNHFEPNLWVCLGDMKEFDVNKVIEKMAKGMDVANSDSHTMKTVIQDHVKDQRFLLVLDDVWEVNRNKWLQLKSLLSSACQGSKIVVTTRVPLVASCVGTTEAYNLKGLPHEECVRLFRKLAFPREAEANEKLMSIGEEIVKKCQGVPLAVRSLGSMLFSESDEREWLAVRDSNMWQAKEMKNDILPILKFSYDHLPSYLKQCFVYCCLFPEDFAFNDSFLIPFWMAHGLLQSSNKNKAPEDIGKQYIKELLSRGFFQDFEDIGMFWFFKMHDMVRELACSFGQGEFATVIERARNISQNVRHVYFEGEQEFSWSSSNAVRSVVGTWAGEVEACILKFKKLRFFHIFNSEIEELPDSIGTLKHLRTLDVSYCRRLKKLPASISKLQNLECMLFVGCTELEEAPNSIWELCNLRKLFITTKQKHLLEKNSISVRSLGSLTDLCFYKCPNIEILFGGMQLHMPSLRRLIVSNCKSLISLVPLESAGTRNNSLLPPLEELIIADCEKLNNLSLMDADMEGLPEWMGKCAETLQYLEINSCADLKALPEWLPNLTSLRTLKIMSCQGLLSLPDGMQRLTSLRKLEISHCSVLSKRCRKGRGKDWPKIAHVPDRLIR